jgi:hypothetical protein
VEGSTVKHKNHAWSCHKYSVVRTTMRYDSIWRAAVFLDSTIFDTQSARVQQSTASDLELLNTCCKLLYPGSSACVGHGLN